MNHLTIRGVAAALALLYALLVTGLNLSHLNDGRMMLIYVAAALIAPGAALWGDAVARRGGVQGDTVAQAGLGVVFGLWALPSSSGLVAILAIVVGLVSAFRSAHRGVAVASLLTGVGVGVGILLLSFSHS